MAETIANPEPAKVISRASECMRRLLEAGLTYEDLQKPINDPEMRRRLVQFWKGRAPETAAASYPVTVNYDLGLDLMVAAGKYDWSNSDINSKHFPISAKGKVELNIELVHFNRTMESDDVLAELDKQGLRPATLPELLAFGATYPEKQREFPIVELGSTARNFDGSRDVACLFSESSERGVRLLWLGFRWYALCRFAAVRK